MGLYYIVLGCGQKRTERNELLCRKAFLSDDAMRVIASHRQFIRAQTETSCYTLLTATVAPVFEISGLLV
jgi:hypothetical protein